MEILLRGVWPHRALSARVVIVTVPRLALALWYLLCTDLTLDPWETVHTDAGRFQIEVNFDEVKELGLGHSQGRSGQGVRRRLIDLCRPRISHDRPCPASEQEFAKAA
jgi:hypothetical protein